MPARRWAIIEGFEDIGDYNADVRNQVFNMSGYGSGATVERWILDWYAWTDFHAHAEETSTWAQSRIAVVFQDGGDESSPPEIFDHTLDWVFNDMLLWTPQSLGTDQFVNVTRWHASSSGYMRTSQGQRKQTAETGGLIWILWGQDAVGSSIRNDLPFRMTWQLRALIQPTV